MSERRRRVLVVSVESPWPAVHGGRIRTAALAESLAESYDVTVAFPDHGQVGPSPVRTRALPWQVPARMRTLVSPRPRLGRHWLLPVNAALQQLATEWSPDAVLWSHSYLAAAGARGLAPVEIVDFANLESRRLWQSVHVEGATAAQRALRFVEYAKSVVWERRVASLTTVCLAISSDDLKWLARRARCAVLTENGVRTHEYVKSPDDGSVLLAASFDYGPNIESTLDVLRHVWPEVVARIPWARLILVGQGGDRLLRISGAPTNAFAVGRVDDISSYYQNAAVVVAAATSGAGRQLKVTEALSWGRVVVATPFSARSAPRNAVHEGAVISVEPREMAEVISRILLTHDDRHARELAAGLAIRDSSWSNVTSAFLVVLDERLSAATDVSAS